MVYRSKIKQLLPSFIYEAIQDGGYRGWVAVFCTLLTWLFWVGTTKSLAVMVPILQDQFNTSTWVMGWMVAIIDATAELVGPIASPLRARFGARLVVTVCGLLAGTSFIISSFVSSLALVTVTLSIFAGIPFGLSNIICREIIGHCFCTSYAFAFGIAGLGSSLAVLILAPLTQFLLDLYGWRGTMMLIGATVMHLAVGGALLRVPSPETNGDYRSLTPIHVDNKDASVDHDARSMASSRYPQCCMTLGSSLHFELFNSSNYWLAVTIAVSFMTMHSAWLIYFVSYATSKGFSLEESANFVVVYGFGKIIGNLTLGIITLSCNGPTVTYLLMGLSLIITTISLAVDPWLVSGLSIGINVFIFGYFQTVLYIMIDVVTKDAVGTDLLGFALGWMSLKCGIARFAFLFFPGLIFDTVGSYTLAWALMGVVNGMAVFPLLVLVWHLRLRKTPSSAS